jgi:hypothetical protein
MRFLGRPGIRIGTIDPGSFLASSMQQVRCYIYICLLDVINIYAPHDLVYKISYGIDVAYNNK